MKAKSILGMTIILVVVLAIAIGCGGGQGDYQSGYDTGYDAGYDVGYNVGHDAGYQSGYTKGYADCQAEGVGKPPVGETFEPITITGAGDKTTPPFEVTTDEWIIEWSYTADEPEWALFWAFIYPRGETAIYVEDISPGSNQMSGSTYCYAGPGEYYIVVGAANIDHWEITISPAP